MDRTIFIGSSTEGLERAKCVQGILDKLSQADCKIRSVLWPDIFTPGSLTFEALEEMLMDCCAAVFVITPDVRALSRNTEELLPRANIMLEFGLVAGRLGRHNIALCSWDVTELPSDLAGLSVIHMVKTKLAPPTEIQSITES
jgi:predicted nucleotide-binding protein